MKKKAIKLFIVSIFAIFAFSVLSFGLVGVNSTLIKAADENVSTGSHVYKTDGASVRIFANADDDKPTDKTGIRFHVEMGVGYSYGGVEIFDGETMNERNNSFKIADGFKTYTLVIPTNLLNEGEELNIDTVGTDANGNVRAIKIDTSEYWFFDKTGNYESVAYVSNIKKHRYTETFSFRGILCKVENGTETVVAQTDVSQRSIAAVSKLALADSRANEDSWNGGERKEAAEKIMDSFIPKGTITYTNSEGAEITETVAWGDVPSNIPNSDLGAWYDTTNGNEFNVSQPLDIKESTVITLEETTSNQFVFTGAADQDDYNGKSGVKIYATLPSEEFADGTQIDPRSINVEYVGNGSFKGIEAVYTMKEETMRLFFQLDSSTLVSGDKIIIKGDSVFYANNVMYKLTEDYTIDYTVSDGKEDYGIFLGYVSYADIEHVSNSAEDASGNGGEWNDYTIRVYFYEDVLIDGIFEFIRSDSHDDSKYPYPVYIQRNDEEKSTNEIMGGVYYWADGQYKILELTNNLGNEKDVYGKNNGDELIIAPGTILKQNGGYYIFEGEFRTRFVADDSSFGGSWKVGTEIGTFGNGEFPSTGNYVQSDNEVRVTTNTRWWPDASTTVTMKVENMAENKTENPYAVYYTSADGTVTNMTNFRYHAYSTYTIFGFCGVENPVAGDVITVIGGTRFWVGEEYYTVTEDVSYYYNGAIWLKDFDESSIRDLLVSDFKLMSYYNSDTEVYLQLTAPLAGMPTTDKTTTTLSVSNGNVSKNGNTVSKIAYYRWDENSIFFIITVSADKDKFVDTLTFEGGTIIWYENVGYRIPDEGYNFIYTGYSKHYYVKDKHDFYEKHEWMLITGENSNVGNAYVSGIANYIDFMYGNEVRFFLNQNILNSNYNGLAVINGKNPAIYNGNEIIDAQYYGTDNTIAVVGAYGEKDGDYVIIPAGSVWWTKNGGTLTITDEIIATYVNGAWVKGDYRASVTVNAPNVTVTGVENIAKGQTYEFKAIANSGYTISKVTVNGVDLPISATNSYSFTANAENTIVIETVIGYDVEFNLGEGAIVDGGAITDGEIIAKVSGDSYTFTVSANEGYKITNVTNATNNGNGSYTVTFDSNKTVTINTEKLYKVTYSTTDDTHASVTATVDNGSYVDSGTTVTFTVTVNSGYAVFVDNATKINDTTYEVTVNGADIDVTAKVAIDVTDRIKIEDRGADEGEVYVGVLDNGIYFNTSVNGTWHVYNKDVITNNGGVDIMEYIYVNGKSARSLITANINGPNSANNCKCWLSNPAAYPVYVETTNDSGLIIKLAQATFGTKFTLTIKEGFRITNASGEFVGVTEDINFNYNRGLIIKSVEVEGVEFTDVTDKLGIENRTDWSNANTPDHLYFAITYTDGTKGWLNVPSGDLAGYWNDHPERVESNYGVDIMEYIYINGKSVRDIVMDNKCGDTSYTGTTDPFNNGSWYAPITVEPTTDSGLFIKILNDYVADLGNTFEITIKSGFTITDEYGNAIKTSADITYVYSNGSLTKK